MQELTTKVQTYTEDQRAREGVVVGRHSHCCMQAADLLPTVVTTQMVNEASHFFSQPETTKTEMHCAPAKQKQFMSRYNQ